MTEPLLLLTSLLLGSDVRVPPGDDGASAFADISFISNVSVPPGDDRGLFFC